MSPITLMPCGDRIYPGTSVHRRPSVATACADTGGSGVRRTDVPGLLSRGAVLVEQLDAITRDGLVLAPDTVKEIGRAEARRSRWTAAALWAIAALLAWVIYRM